MRLVAGIDIGLKGGLVVLELETGALRLFAEMPTRVAQRGKPVVDGRALYQWLPNGIVLAVIEDTHSFGHESRSSCFSFGRSTGRTEVVLEVRGIPYEAVTPQAWKAEVLSGTKRDKPAAIGWASNRYPTLPQYDGLADAACMAEFARRRILGGER